MFAMTRSCGNCRALKQDKDTGLLSCELGFKLEIIKKIGLLELNAKPMYGNCSKPKNLTEYVLLISSINKKL